MNTKICIAGLNRRAGYATVCDLSTTTWFWRHTFSTEALNTKCIAKGIYDYVKLTGAAQKLFIAKTVK